MFFRIFACCASRDLRPNATEGKIRENTYTGGTIIYNSNATASVTVTHDLAFGTGLIAMTTTSNTISTGNSTATGKRTLANRLSTDGASGVEQRFAGVNSLEFTKGFEFNNDLAQTIRNNMTGSAELIFSGRGCLRYLRGSRKRIEKA